MPAWRIGRATTCAALLPLLLFATSAARAQGAGRSFGVQVAPDAPRDTLGALITAVVPGTLAERMGLKAGDKILRLGRIDLVRRATDPRNAATGAGRLRVALADPSDLVPVLVWRDGEVLTGIGSWGGSVPVPLQDANTIIGALTTLASQGTVPVETSGSVAVPSTGGSAVVPSTGGAGSVPAFGEATVPSTGGKGTVPAFGDSRVPSAGGSGSVSPGGGSPPVPTPSGGRSPKGGPGGAGGGSGSSDTGGLANRDWRAACASLAGPRPAGKYYWLSRSGSSSEMLWLNRDGSYSTQRSSAYSSYTEDGCFAIEGARITFYKVASAAMASAPTATGQRGVTLGSASGATFEPRTVSFAIDKGALVIGGDSYAPTTDR